MLKNIFITSLRNMFRNRTFSIINIIGLSVSMSLGLLVILIIKEQYSFDNFHKDGDRIYRINTSALRVNGQAENYASSPLPVATSLQNNYSFTDEIARLSHTLNGDLVYENVTVPISGFFTEPSFFSIFNFNLKEGDPVQALSTPDGIIISRDAAKKIFGNADPINKIVEIKGYGNFTVKGVLEKSAHKSHLDFEALASIEALRSFEKQTPDFSSLDNWRNYYTGYTYIKTKKGVSKTEVEHALNEIAQENYKGLTLETRDKGYRFYLQPLSKISPGPLLSNNLGRALPELIIKFLAILAFVIILMAGLNYVNLMIAKSLKRSREIGVRKVMGAGRRQVFFQFIGESVLFAVIALCVSYLILQFLKSAFLQLHLTQEFSIVLKEDPVLYLIFFIFALIVGIAAGLLPAAYLSGFKPVTVLKDATNMKLNTKNIFRRILMVVQFSLSLIFIVGVLIIYAQIHYLFTADYGIKEKNILNVRLQGNNFDQLANEMKKVAGVKRIGGLSHSLGTWSDWSSDYKRTAASEAFDMRDYRVDNNYLENIGVQFLAGKNFTNESTSAKESEVILNEKALPLFGFSSPAEAVGQSIYVQDSLMLTVSGVVKDFHFRPLTDLIGPVAFRYRPGDFSIISMAIEPSSKARIMQALQSAWKQIDSVHPLQSSMMEDEIDDAYINSGMLDVLSIVGYISFLSIVLACLGMLGMVMYSTQLRVKEIGVRRVLGASVKDVTFLLGRSFMILMGIGFLVGIPLSYLLGNLFLQNYSYRISSAPLLVIAGIMIIGILGLITICSQTIKAALANPVKSLRTE